MLEEVWFMNDQTPNQLNPKDPLQTPDTTGHLQKSPTPQQVRAVLAVIHNVADQIAN